MAKERSYLHHLKFESKLKDSLIAKYLANPRLLILLLIAIVTVGGGSFTNLPHRVYPEVKIPMVIVSTVLPGASPEDVESLITIPIEDSISGVDNVSKVTSSSHENVSVVQVEFNRGVDSDKKRIDIQSAIDQISLPSDAKAPIVQTIDFENTPIWTFALVGKGDVASLNSFSKTLKKGLEDLPTINKVTTGGLEQEEISVEIDQSSLLTYGISPLQLSTLIRSALNSFPAGNVVSRDSIFAISINPQITNIDDIRRLQIKIKGNVVTLSDIAKISSRSKPGQNPSYIASSTLSPERSVTFNIFKTKTTNIDKAVQEAEAQVAKSLNLTNGEFKVISVSNSGEDTTKQFTDLTHDFIETIFLVFIVLFIFLGVRQAFVSLFAVPLTFLISFTVMNSTGISLNFISMFSLLLALGLLVDDTIVVISAMTAYYKSGKFSPLETGILVWKDFLIPVLTTTLTTVFAFLPILISTGIIGEFIKSIPIVVSSTLIASFAVAMLITLPLMIILLRPAVPSRVVKLLKILSIIFLLGVFVSILPKGPLMVLGIISLLIFLFVTVQVRLAIIKKTSIYLSKQKRRHKSIEDAPHYIENGLINFQMISSKYQALITKVLSSQKNRRRTVAMVVIFSIFSYLLVPLGFVKNEFFPKSDQNFINMTIELPTGTSSQTTSQEAIKLINTLRNTKNVKFVTADIGQTSGSFGEAEEGSGNNILFSFILQDKKDRAQSSIEIGQGIRDRLANYTKGKITVSEATGGPPAGADLQLNLYGKDLSSLSRYADKIVDYLKEQKGVTDISKSIAPGTSKIVFIPDQASLAAENITQDQLGLTLRAFVSGFKLESAKISIGGNTPDSKQDITLRSSQDLLSANDLTTVAIPTQQGSIPMSSLGEFRLMPNPTLINREDGKRIISVTATVSQGFSATELNSRLENFASAKLHLQDGYSWKTGGVNEENDKSVKSILQAMLISFLLIIVTMVVQFSSFRKATIVMLVIPLSVSGVFIIFALSHTPLSFPALIGILALFGIVVKNSILIVDKISANEKIGMDFLLGIVDGASSRLEPIALTSLAAIMGLVPITISDPLWRGLGGAIISGLIFSGTIMLFFIPVVYYSWFGPKIGKTKHSKGR